MILKNWNFRFNHIKYCLIQSIFFFIIFSSKLHRIKQKDHNSNHFHRATVFLFKWISRLHWHWTTIFSSTSQRQLPRTRILHGNRKRILRRTRRVECLDERGREEKKTRKAGNSLSSRRFDLYVNGQTMVMSSVACLI